MILSYKNREVRDPASVQVYRNLNNSLFSIRCSNTKLVIGHGDSFVLTDAKPVVSEAGRKRVIKNKQRNVHAYVEGKLTKSCESICTDKLEEVYYNPYKLDKFILLGSEKEFKQGDLYFKDGKCYLI